MDADRARNLPDPNDAFLNTPDGVFGSSGSGDAEMRLMLWIHDKVTALLRRLRRR